MRHGPVPQQMWSGEDAPRAGGGQSAAGRDGRATKPLPKDALIVIPVRNAVLFPGVLSPVTVGRAASVAAAQEAVKNELRAGFFLQRDPQKAHVSPSHPHCMAPPG